MTFASRRTVDGALQVEARGGDLSLRKTVTSDGSSVLELGAQNDSVTVRFSAGTARVTRQGATATVDFHDASAASLDVVRRLLADSPAVQLTRVAAANLMDSEDNSPESAAVLIGDALLGALTGDPGALGRVGRHLSRHVRAGTRPAATDCYFDWERQVFAAWTDYMGCLDEIWIWNPIRIFCAPRYLLMTEAYWFQFLSCIGFSGLIG